LGLQSKTEWFQWAKSGNRPIDIPVNPGDSYKGKGWQGWAHFLGTTNKKAGEVVYRDFNAAREWARSQGLQSQAEWKAFAAPGRLPKDIPANPWHVYRHRGWISIGDWLGKGEHHSKNKQWRSFPDARDWARVLGLRSTAEWSELCKSGSLPDDIPAMPGRVYKDLGWISMGDWLGTDTVAPYKKTIPESRGSARICTYSRLSDQDRIRTVGTQRHAPGQHSRAPVACLRHDWLAGMGRLVRGAQSME
jgi:hypothetical protein